MLLRPATDQISRDLTAVLSAIPAGFDHLWATDFRIIPLTVGFPICSYREQIETRPDRALW